MKNVRKRIGMRGLFSKVPDADVVVVAPRDDLVVPEGEAGHCASVPHERRHAPVLLAHPYL